MSSFARDIGRVLRRVRQSRGFTLRHVAAMSEGRFKPTSIAGYERGERSISLERFCELCRLYAIAPERLLLDITRGEEGRTEPEIDLTILEALGSDESAAVSEFIRQVRSLRGESQGDTIVLRIGDLEALATSSGRRPDELLEILGPVLRHKE
jgi:transcriptional regulator with XRE-family HTH domain